MKPKFVLKQVTQHFSLYQADIQDDDHEVYCSTPLMPTVAMAVARATEICAALNLNHDNAAEIVNELHAEREKPVTPEKANTGLLLKLLDAARALVNVKESCGFGWHETGLDEFRKFQAAVAALDHTGEPVIQPEKPEKGIVTREAWDALKPVPGTRTYEIRQDLGGNLWQFVQYTASGTCVEVRWIQTEVDQQEPETVTTMAQADPSPELGLDDTLEWGGYVIKRKQDFDSEIEKQADPEPGQRHAQRPSQIVKVEDEVVCNNDCLETLLSLKGF